MESDGLADVGFLFTVMKMSWNQVEVLVAQYCQRTYFHKTVQSKMLKMIDFCNVNLLSDTQVGS